MTKYLVTLPVAGFITVEVEAADKEEAIDAAMSNADWTVTAKGNTEAGEFDLFEHIVRGNVCNAPVVDVSVEKIDD